MTCNMTCTYELHMNFSLRNPQGACAGMPVQACLCRRACAGVPVQARLCRRPCEGVPARACLLQSKKPVPEAPSEMSQFFITKRFVSDVFCSPVRPPSRGHPRKPNSVSFPKSLCRRACIYIYIHIYIYIYTHALYIYM